VKLPYNNILALPNTDAMKSDWRENDVNWILYPPTFWLSITCAIVSLIITYSQTNSTSVTSQMDSYIWMFNLSDRVKLTFKLSRVIAPTGSIFSASDQLIPETSGMQKTIESTPSSVPIVTPILESILSIPFKKIPFFISRSEDA
jgi:hypothetical protein